MEALRRGYQGRGYTARPQGRHGCTADAARVLRVPGTYNRKDPKNPRVVKLLALGADCDFDKDFAHLKAAPVTATVTPGAKPPPFDLTPFAAGPAAAFTGINSRVDDLSEGLLHRDLPLEFDQIYVGCPMFQEASITKGKNHTQPLWALVLLASSFFEDGRKWAHHFSNGHPDYEPAITDAKYDEKLKYRAEKGLGWPSCGAFESAGSKFCSRCVYKGKIKSPLNLALPNARPALEIATGQVRREQMLPVEAILTLHKQGVSRKTLFTALNETYAVVIYGSEVLIASIKNQDLLLMKPEDFHKMFGNVRFFEGKRTVEVSRLWFQWKDRRRYLGRGLVFEPGSPLDIEHDMLNLWRGFGITPKQGVWTLMSDHVFNVVCSGNQEYYDYLIKWMAYGVKHPNEPVGVAVAFRGAQGAGKGIVARTYGSLFGKHYAHIANGDQLTGRFNASLATSCAVFLDEALWAGDKKGEGVLKALITEPRLQLEAKFRDPIMVQNRLRIMVASNEDWIVPAGIGDRRWFILDVANTYAGTAHQGYWVALYGEVKNGGAAGMFYDLLAMDLSDFDVRAVPHTAAKAQQQAHSLNGTDAWIYHVLQEGKIGFERWQKTGLAVSTDNAYFCYEEYSKRQREYKPNKKSDWSKKFRKALGSCLGETRTGGKERERRFVLASLADCRLRFALHVGATKIEWEPECGAEDMMDAIRFMRVKMPRRVQQPTLRTFPNPRTCFRERWRKMRRTMRFCGT